MPMRQRSRQPWAAASHSNLDEAVVVQVEPMASVHCILLLAGAVDTRDVERATLYGIGGPLEDGPEVVEGGGEDAIGGLCGGRGRKNVGRRNRCT